MVLNRKLGSFSPLVLSLEWRGCSVLTEKFLDGYGFVTVLIVLIFTSEVMVRHLLQIPQRIWWEIVLVPLLFFFFFFKKSCSILCCLYKIKSDQLILENKAVCKHERVWASLSRVE